MLGSNTVSSPDNPLSHVDLFFSMTCVKVAISRARRRAAVVCNPRLLELDAITVKHLRVGNTLAWLHAETKGE